MRTQPDAPQLPVLRLAACQNEIQELLQRLRTLGHTHNLRGLSSEIEETYHATLDDLAALEIYLELYQQALITNVPATAADGADGYNEAI